MGSTKEFLQLAERPIVQQRRKAWEELLVRYDAIEALFQILYRARGQQRLPKSLFRVSNQVLSRIIELRRRPGKEATEARQYAADLLKRQMERW